jgi:hypothetical protein
MRNARARVRERKPDVDKLLTDPRFRKILELDFSNMIPFVISNIRKGGVIPFFYMTVNLVNLLFIVLYPLWLAGHGFSGSVRIFWQIAAGILAGSILVIPPHELFHGLAYRILGARTIKFGVDLQQFIFYVTADRFPISRGQLGFLAMTPFVLINLGIFIPTVLWIPRMLLFSTSLLLSHNIMCIGDFAMFSYALRQNGNLYTYDDIGKKKSYFYIKEEEL